MAHESGRTLTTGTQEESEKRCWGEAIPASLCPSLWGEVELTVICTLLGTKVLAGTNVLVDVTVAEWLDSALWGTWDSEGLAEADPSWHRGSAAHPRLGTCISLGLT